MELWEPNKGLQWVKAHERATATGGKTNENKLQGRRLGSHRLHKPPWRKYNWIDNNLSERSSFLFGNESRGRDFRAG
eukprot:scaffold76935_cov18-Tisochrysis_lutea.AAC.1